MEENVQVCVEFGCVGAASKGLPKRITRNATLERHGHTHFLHTAAPARSLFCWRLGAFFCADVRGRVQTRGHLLLVRGFRQHDRRRDVELPYRSSQVVRFISTYTIQYIFTVVEAAGALLPLGCLLASF